MRPTLTELRERSNQNLRDFLNVEVELGMTFAPSAKYQKSKGNVERYETNKRNALAALGTIDRLIVRLPAESRKEIAARRPELAKAVASL